MLPDADDFEELCGVRDFDGVTDAETEGGTNALVHVSGRPQSVLLATRVLCVQEDLVWCKSILRPAGLAMIVLRHSPRGPRIGTPDATLDLCANREAKLLWCGDPLCNGCLGVGINISASAAR